MGGSKNAHVYGKTEFTCTLDSGKQGAWWESEELAKINAKSTCYGYYVHNTSNPYGTCDGVVSQRT